MRGLSKEDGVLFTDAIQSVSCDSFERSSHHGVFL